MSQPILETLAKHRVLPIIVIDDAAHAAPLADALMAGGLPLAEVTFRTPAAAAAIRTFAGKPGMTIGAGTVLDVDTVKRAVDAGATFMVTPGFSSKVVTYCVENGIPITPGCSTGTDLQMALEHGVTTVKFFPAETAGGIKTLKAIAAPFHMMRFIPTGGITEKSLADYLAFKPVTACGGSWMVAKDLLAQGKFDRVTELTKQAVDIARTTAAT